MLDKEAAVTGSYYFPRIETAALLMIPGICAIYLLTNKHRKDKLKYKKNSNA